MLLLLLLWLLHDVAWQRLPGREHHLRAICAHDNGWHLALPVRLTRLREHKLPLTRLLPRRNQTPSGLPHARYAEPPAAAAARSERAPLLPVPGLLVTPLAAVAGFVAGAIARPTPASKTDLLAHSAQAPANAAEQQMRSDCMNYITATSTCCSQAHTWQMP